MSGNNKKRNNKNKITNINNKQNQKKTRDLEKTNKIDLVFDEERLEKTELLDLSFIEDASKFNSNELKEEKKVDKNVEILELEDERLLTAGRKSPIIILLMILVAFTLGFAVNVLFMQNKENTEIKVEKEEIIKNDENIVFVGDSIFEFYDVGKYFEGRKVVNSGISGHKTTDILENMERRIYRYNPSDVFLLIGTNDFWDKELSLEDTIANIGKIIEGIKENRPHAKINVISVLPINNSDDEKINHGMVAKRNNEEITEINNGVKSICEKEKVTYIDLYSLLVDENGDLDIDYTTEGLHITPDGYTIITKELKKYITK